MNNSVAGTLLNKYSVTLQILQINSPTALLTSGLISFVGDLLFLVYYIIFLVGLEWSAPGYIDRAGNLGNLSGINVSFMPLEEFLFAIAFGMY